MAKVVFDHVTRDFNNSGKPAVNDLALSVDDGEFLVLVGPSGCGKTTSLRMLAGLEPVDDGSVHIGERDVTDLAPKDRDVAMVFQNYALYPHMTAAANMGFALKVARLPKAEIKRRVLEAAKLLDLEDYLDRKPKALSGGQRQRVAMGRAIVREPQVFLMDEPLSNLDAKLRVQTRTQIASLQRRLGVTTVYVTHDQVEAMTMGDRVAILREGVLQQVGTPRELYDNPKNAFVAGFIGSPTMNILQATVSDNGVMLAGSLVPLDRERLLKANGSRELLLGFRPEDIRLGTDSAGVPLEVLLVEELGSDSYAYGELQGSDGVTTQIAVRTDGRNPPTKGEILHLDIARTHLFFPDSGDRVA